MEINVLLFFFFAKISGNLVSGSWVVESFSVSTDTKRDKRIVNFLILFTTWKTLILVLVLVMLIIIFISRHHIVQRLNEFFLAFLSLFETVFKTVNFISDNLKLLIISSRSWLAMYSSKSGSIIEGVLLLVEIDELSIKMMTKVDNNAVDSVQFPEDIRDNRLVLEGCSSGKLIKHDFPMMKLMVENMNLLLKILCEISLFS